MNILRIFVALVLLFCAYFAKADALPERPRLTVAVVVDTDIADHTYAVDAINRAVTLIEADLWMHVQILSVTFDQNISARTKAEDLLDDIVRYRTNDPMPGVTLFLTGRSTVRAGYNYTASAYADSRGYTYVASAYTNDGAGFVTLLYDRLDYLEIAHQLGHMLGAPHDDDGPCRSQSRASGYLMQADIVGPDKFSDCTQGQVNDYVYARAGDFYEALQRSALVVAPTTSAPVTQPVQGGGSLGSGFLCVLLLLVVCVQTARVKRWQHEASKETARANECGDCLAQLRGRYFDECKEAQLLRHIVSDRARDVTREQINQHLRIG